MISNRWLPTVLLTLTFALGLSLGYIIRSEFVPNDVEILRRDVEISRRMGPGGGGMGPGRTEFIPPFLFDEMVRELQIAPEQRTKLERILDAHRSQVETLRQEVIHPKQQAIMDSTRAQLQTILTPDQIRRFMEMRQRMGREGFRRRGPGPPGDRKSVV